MTGTADRDGATHRHPHEDRVDAEMSNHRRRRISWWLAVAAIVALVGLAGCSDDDGGSEDAADTDDTAQQGNGDDSGLQVSAISTAADMVTGGDVLVEISGVDGDLEVSVDDRDVSDAFGPAEAGTATGLVTGLEEGESVLRAIAGDAETTLTLTNHPITGPVFSGPHLEPLACTTEAHGLGEPTDDDCSAPTVVRWSYVSTEDEIHPLDDPSIRPDDIATTEVDVDGGTQTVDLVVRTESGTIDRGVYWIHVLDPEPTQEAWDPSAWNETLVYRFGGGCGTSFSQGNTIGDGAGSDVAGPMLDLDLLRDGYAQATNTFNTFQTQCNDVLSAEAMMMTRERFAEGFGAPESTVGEGGSGGAIQQYLIAQNYPGLLDAVVASLPFPDALSIAPGVTDCGLLERYYGTPTGGALADDQRSAVNGHLTSDTCGSWVGSFLSNIDPTVGCALDDELVYHPEDNPDGARCTLQDSLVNLVGTDADTGAARRPIDNTGVQYGLEALRQGDISVDEFLDLNEGIGGYDIDGNWVPERMEADEDAVANAYRNGRVTTGGGLTQVPVLTLTVFTDGIGDIHDRFRAFSLRERLRLPDGEVAPNDVLWTRPGGTDVVDSIFGTAARGVRLQMVDLAVEWSRALEQLGVPIEERTAENLRSARPDTAADDCITPDGDQFSGPQVYDDGEPCADAYPVSGDPRIAAGGPLHSLVGKCTLTDVDPASYGVELSAAQQDRLRAVFPDGVCDWEAPGVGRVDLGGTWLDYSDGPPA